MKQSREEILAKLNSIAQPDTGWLKAAQKRVADQAWLKHSQATALKILRTLRAKGLTQKDLAEALSVSPQQVSKWVKGKENFTFETVSKIEAALDVNLIEVRMEKRSVVKVEWTKELLISGHPSPANYQGSTQQKLVYFSAESQRASVGKELNFA
jgi:transcriptional regulator with XRE-family HTH domain